MIKIEPVRVQRVDILRPEGDKTYRACVKRKQVEKIEKYVVGPGFLSGFRIHTAYSIHDFGFAQVSDIDVRDRLTPADFTDTLCDMKKARPPHSTRIFIRREKARIRREISDSAEAEKRIRELVVALRARYNGK